MKIPKLILAAVLALAGGPVWAADITITLDATTLTAATGQTVGFSGVITNNGPSTVDLNDIDVNISSTAFMLDLTDFFTGPATLAGNSSTSSFAFFTATPDNDPSGIYDGLITILGGTEVGNVYDPTTQNILGTAVFHVDVQAASQSAPEPSTLALMAIGILVGYSVHHRRQAQR